MNGFVQNWFYTMTALLVAGAQPALALYFSTVLPAVIELFELLATIPALTPALPASQPVRACRARGGAPAVAGRRAAVAAGHVPPIRLHADLVLPTSCGPDDNLAGRPSAIGRLMARDWNFLTAVPLAGLLCGFFWEMWNFYALPKWQYYLPFLNWTPHYFEMPIPGLLGYLPFASSSSPCTSSAC